MTVRKNPRVLTRAQRFQLTKPGFRARPSDPAANRRLAGMLSIALAFHAVVVFGLSFEPQDPVERNDVSSLEVILVQRKTVEEPEEADYLAQASQRGGGENPEPERPRAPTSSPLPKPETGDAPAPSVETPPPAQREAPQATLVREEAPLEVETTEEEKQETTNDMTAQELLRRSMEVARLESEIGQSRVAYAKRPRRKFISANTKEYVYAAYMQAWVAKVERIGNLNYPDEARRRQLAGNLVLTVALNRDGSLDRIDIVESSGHAVLDEAALRIVRLGSPYSPLPEDTDDAVDILHITRTWQFLPGNVLRHK